MLGEPTFRKVLHNDDLGTRLSHMVDLHDLWNTAYGILTRPDLFHTELEKIRAGQLEIAIALLIHHMEAEFNVTQYAKAINDAKHDPPDDFVTHRDTV